MRTFKLIVALPILFINTSFVLKPITWKVKEPYTISVKHDGMEVGTFTGLKANIIFDEEKPESSSFSATINATTIQNKMAKEDLAVSKFPAITFVSSAIKKTKDGYEATGKLTIKGITKEAKLPFTFDSKKDDAAQFPFKFKQTFYGKFTIVGNDFKISKTSTFIVDLTIPVSK